MRGPSKKRALPSYTPDSPLTDSEQLWTDGEATAHPTRPSSQSQHGLTANRADGLTATSSRNREGPRRSLTGQVAHGRPQENAVIILDQP